MYFSDKYFECVGELCTIKAGYSWDGCTYFLSCAGTGNSLLDTELMLLYISDYVELVDIIDIDN